jgi:hypothetical protein
MSKMKQVAYLALTFVGLLASFIMLGFVVKIIYKLIKFGWLLV